MPGPSSHPRRRQRSRHGQGRSSREDTPDVDPDDAQLSQSLSQPAATASELVQQAQEATNELKGLLKSQAPWSKDAFNVRQRARNAYLCILFQHPLHPHAQSIELLWISTTYTLISAYRDAVARIEATLPPAGPGSGSGSGSGSAAGTGTGTRASKEALSHLRTTLSRFRQALVKEAAFYHSLITRVVSFHRLQDRTAPYLAQVHIPVAPGEDAEDDPSLAPHLSKEELDKKIDIVYKGLICLGDLERYKEQYSDKARKERSGGAGAGAAEGAPAKNGRAPPADRFAKAVMYYEVARALQPDNGTAFNQLAVIDGYLGDNFHCTYHYFRALEVRLPFPSGEANLERVLKKVFDKWRSQRHASAAENGEPSAPAPATAPESQEDADVFKRELLTVVSILFIRAGHFNALCPAVAVRFAQLLRERKLLSETIVKTTAMAIGSHWQARLGANAGTGDAERRHNVEGLALVLLMSVFTGLVVVAAEEAEDALAQLGDDSAVADDDDAQPLAPRISAVLRRLLPSLRIMSRWLKVHVEYVGRLAPASPDAARSVSSFWQAYGRLMSALARAFPLPQLPELDRPLEEDRDMRGFLPLHVARVVEDAPAPVDGDVHPNEEQLMRLADLLVDAKLLFWAGDGREAPPAELAQAEETQSQAETEDDPVSLAMRASLGGDGISVGARSLDDDDEVILWGRSTPVVAPAAPTTAQGLLQSLTLAPSPGNTRPPSLLFGGMDGGGQTIWTMSREESQKGMQRASAQRASEQRAGEHRASEQWDAAAGPASAGPVGLSGQWDGGAGSRQASGASGQWSRAGSRQASGQWDSHSAPSSARPSVSGAAPWDARPWDPRPPGAPGLTGPPGLTPPGVAGGLSPGAGPGAGPAPPAPPGFAQWPPSFQRPGSGQGFAPPPPHYAAAPGQHAASGAVGPRPPPGLGGPLGGPLGSAPGPPGLRSWSPQAHGIPAQPSPPSGATRGAAGGDIWGPPRPQNSAQHRNSADTWAQAQFQQFGARWNPPQAPLPEGAAGSGSGASANGGAGAGRTRWREG